MFKIHGTGTCFVCFVRKKFKKWTGQNCTDPNDKVILNVRYCTVLFEFDGPWLLSICYCYNNDEMLGVPDLRNFYPDLKFFHCQIFLAWHWFGTCTDSFILYRFGSDTCTVLWIRFRIHINNWIGV